MLNQEWLDILNWVKTELQDPQRTQLLMLCEKFESTQSPKEETFFKLETTPKPKKQSKKDIQSQLISENPNMGNLQNILKKF